ncbi:MAG: glycoside hydrolase family 3 C-terminal domain-containing protein [Clostridia bacterium]|nr:glycoside hydrolase family 3 C-terminal domain-containing protein [Clostridia bacterium]
MQDVRELLEQLSENEKIALVSGTNNMYTQPVPRLGIPSLRMSDGPHGLRILKDEKGWDSSKATALPATSFPTAATVACSWDPELIGAMGRAIGEECLYYGVHILLGPGVNIKRNPLCGRNFEYYSEDPYLAGTLGAAMVRGVQGCGVGVSLKHFAMNNSETFRYTGDSVADSRAMREIYLKPFSMIVQTAHPETLMCAYNRVNGTYCSENAQLLTAVLRDEWGFAGAVMTDWGATHDRVEGLKSGLDLEMPGDTAICRKWIRDALRTGYLKREELDRPVGRILELVSRHADAEKVGTADFEAHDALAAKAASRSAVLLENDGMLPLSANEKLFVCGEMFARMRYQGGGSSQVFPYRITTPKDAFDADGIDYVYAPGYSEKKHGRDLVQEALEKAKPYEKVLVFAGLPDDSECEGGDREHMRLPEDQLKLIDALTDAGHKVCVVLFGCSPVELPFAKRVSGLLYMALPGQNGGRAVSDLLFGRESPSGRLAETWPLSYADVLYGDRFAKEEHEIYYESVFVGYRHYASAPEKVLYPFGYGLGYTSFSFGDISVEIKDGTVSVSCTVRNTGERNGSAVPQVYVKGPCGRVARPERELRAFRKVFVQAHGCAQVTAEIPLDELRFWHKGLRKWVLEGGLYTVQICSDALTPVLSQTIHIDGEVFEAPDSEEIYMTYEAGHGAGITDELFEKQSGLAIRRTHVHLPLTPESRLAEYRLTAAGRMIRGLAKAVIRRMEKKADKEPDGPEKDAKKKTARFYGRVIDTSSARALSMGAGKSMPFNLAQAVAHLGNGHVFRAIKAAFSRIRAPRLPKDEKADRKKQRKNRKGEQSGD